MNKIKKKASMIRERDFYRMFFSLTLSLAFQNFLTYSVQMADNLMLGIYQESALSGAALCNQIHFLLQLLVIGAGDGVVVIGSQYWGSHKTKPIINLIGVALRFTIGISLALSVIAFFFPNAVLSLLTNDVAVIEAGVEYLQIICFTYIIFAITNLIVVSLRAVGEVKIGFLLSVSTLIINIGVNYCLIYGNFGFPELGIRGAAVATLFSRIIELMILLIYLKKKEHILNLTFSKLFHIDRSFYADYRKTSLPILMNQFQWGLAQGVQSGILGHLGGAVIAANSISIMLFQILAVVVYGAAGASAIMIGKTIGSDKKDELFDMVKTLQVIFVALGIAASVCILLLRAPILSFYNITPLTGKLATGFMTILSITAIGTSYQMCCDAGIITGGGDTAFSAKMNFISMWFLLIPVSIFAAYTLKLDPVIVFFLLKSDQIYKCIPVALHLHSWKWMKKVVRAEPSVTVTTP